ncbi:hypothetical protein BC941DRAFT_423001 [Chlamydoabsidia padenii]|nr:hypothetical protein BC941DRAFT_423001 [Chlamydoabsidia padenii]
MQSMPYYPQGYQGPQYAGAGAVINNGQPMMPHPGLPPMHHHDPNAQNQKRKQVKNACTNCQKACKKCDDARPCPRCVKYNIADSCVNSVRKERKKGIKRGPYKRRQKTDGDRVEVKNDANGQYANALRAPPMPYGFPGNLNQYGQPNYDYSAHQMVGPPYNMVNPMYHQMGYPVMMQGGNQGDAANRNNNSNNTTPTQQQQGFHPSLPQHYGNMVQQGQQQQQQDSPQQQQGSPQVYYQQQQPATESAQPSPEPKSQAMTPMPSASNSTATASSPSESTTEDDGSKYARLSQLCTAALHQGKPASESTTNQDQPEQTTNSPAQAQQ